MAEISQQIINLCSNYEIKEELGEGAFAHVYKAFDKADGKIVALKCIDINKHITKEKNKSIKDLKIRLLQTQVSILLGCQNNNIIKCYGVLDNQNWKIIILQFCEDGSLYQIIEKNGPIPQKQAVNIISQLIVGFAQLHKKKIIHRDLKTQNILVHKGVYKIADFGLAKIKTELSRASMGTTVGSSFSMAPQVMKGLQYDIQADIWSLGIIFYQILTNSVPFLKNVSPQQIKQTHNKINSINISQQSKNFLKGVFILNPKQRLKWFDLYKMYNNKNGLFHLLNQNQVVVKPKTKPKIRDITDYSNQNNKQQNQKIKQQPKQVSRKQQQTNCIVSPNEQLIQNNGHKMQQQIQMKQVQQDIKNKQFIKLIDNYQRMKYLFDNILNPLYQNQNILFKPMDNEFKKVTLFFILLVSTQIIQILDQNSNSLYLDFEENQIQLISENNKTICDMNKLYKQMKKQQNLNMKYLSSLLNLKITQKNKNTFSFNSISQKDIHELQQKYLCYKCKQNEHIQKTTETFSKFYQLAAAFPPQIKQIFQRIKNNFCTNYNIYIQSRVR